MNCALSGFDVKEELSSSSFLVLLFLPFLLVSCPLCPGSVPSQVSFPILFPSSFPSFPFCPFSSLSGCPFSCFLAFLAFVFMFFLCSGHLKSYLFVQHSALALSPSPSWHPTEGVGLARVIPPPPPPTLTWSKPGPTILFGLHWKPNMEFYDYQKINGLRFPRLIQPSIWSQSLNIAGQDPLTLPLSKVLQGGKENFWLRILASGKEIQREKSATLPL